MNQADLLWCITMSGFWFSKLLPAIFQTAWSIEKWYYQWKKNMHEPNTWTKQRIIHDVWNDLKISLLGSIFSNNKNVAWPQHLRVNVPNMLTTYKNNGKIFHDNIWSADIFFHEKIVKTVEKFVLVHGNKCHSAKQWSNRIEDYTPICLRQFVIQVHQPAPSWVVVAHLFTKILRPVFASKTMSGMFNTLSREAWSTKTCSILDWILMKMKTELLDEIVFEIRKGSEKCEERCTPSEQADDLNRTFYLKMICKLVRCEYLLSRWN